MTIHDQRNEPPRRNAQSSGSDSETGDVGFASLPKTRGAGMINVEVTDEAGTRRVLMVRFPRAKAAIGTAAVTVGIFGLPWLIVPLLDTKSGLPDWALSLVIVLVLALLFGWYLVLLLITAVRGGFLALTQTGVLIQTGLSSVLIPWTAIQGVVADTDGSKARNPVLRLSLRGNHNVPGWPWPAALSPVLLGSSRRRLRILAWWFQPVPIHWVLALVRYLVRHPEERPRIGIADPELWDLFPSHVKGPRRRGPVDRGPGAVDGARSSSRGDRGDR